MYFSQILLEKFCLKKKEWFRLATATKVNSPLRYSALNELNRKWKYFSHPFHREL